MTPSKQRDSLKNELHLEPELVVFGAVAGVGGLVFQLPVIGLELEGMLGVVPADGSADLRQLVASARVARIDPGVAASDLDIPWPGAQARRLERAHHGIRTRIIPVRQDLSAPRVGHGVRPGGGA